MVKIKAKDTINTALRLLVNVIVAGIIYMVAMLLLNSIETSTGIIVSSIVTLIVLIVIIPQIFSMRKGPELIVDLILAIPAGLIVITLIKEIFKVEFVVPALGSADVGIFSLSMAVAIGSYFLADLVRDRVGLLR